MQVLSTYVKVLDTTRCNPAWACFYSLLCTYVPLEDNDFGCWWCANSDACSCTDCPSPLLCSLPSVSAWVASVRLRLWSYPCAWPRTVKFFFVGRTVSFLSAKVNTPKECQSACFVLVQAIFTKAAISPLLRAIEPEGIYFAASVRGCLVLAFTCGCPFTFMLILNVC